VTRVGILGGGQLGSMLATALRKLDAEVSIYDPDPAAPALLRGGRGVTASWSDRAALSAFVAGCDVVTYEFENVETAVLRALAAERPIRPSVEVLATSQDRVAEKRFMAAAGLPHVAFRAVASAAELPAALADFGLPAIVKTARGGYDGKGQAVVRTVEEGAAVAAGFAGAAGGFVLEEPIALEAELSCIVARSAAGEEAVFPVFENFHRDHILDVTVLPARLPPGLGELARATALEAARALGVVGLLTVEFFLGRSARDGSSGRTPEGGPGGRGGPRLYINEFAPRPHNSGHVTLKACTFSQYDALARVLLDAPLAQPELVGPGAFCMGNLLGDVWLAQGRRAPGDRLDLGAWADFPDVIDVMLYGKREPRARRKMGHFIVRGPSAEQAMARAAAFRDALRRPRPE